MWKIVRQTRDHYRYGIPEPELGIMMFVVFFVCGVFVGYIICTNY